MLRFIRNRIQPGQRGTAGPINAGYGGILPRETCAKGYCALATNLLEIRRYAAEIYRDGDDADYRTAKRHSIAIEKRVVRSADTLTLKLALGGGQAIRFVAGK